MLRMITNRSPSTKLKPLPRAEAPPPRRASAAFPSPYGGEWMALQTIVGRWHCEVKSEEFMWLARQIIVGRWPPCPVLQQEARVFTPLSNGEGLGGGASVYLCNIASVFWNASNYSLKAWVSGCEMRHIRGWNGPNYDLKPSISETKGIKNKNCKQTMMICLQFIRF